MTQHGLVEHKEYGKILKQLDDKFRERDDWDGFGLNFLVMDAVDPNISINLEKASLETILKAICKQANLSYHVDNYAVVLETEKSE